MVICLEQGADLHTAQLMLLPLTVPCFSKIQIGFIIIIINRFGHKAINRFRHKVVPLEALGPGIVLVSRERSEGLREEECL